MVTPDTLLLDRVAQPFADRFLRDDQAQRVAAFLLPGVWLADTALWLIAPGADGITVGLALIWLLGVLSMARDLRSASRDLDRGFANPLRVKWWLARLLWLALGGAFALVLGASALLSEPVALRHWANGASTWALLVALYLGSTNRPAGVQDRRWVAAGGVA